MGFRSTFCTVDYPIRWPQWFRDKYERYVHVPESGALHSRCECKVYSTWCDLAEDVHKAIDWDEWNRPNRFNHHFRFTICFLHECGGVTKAVIMRDGVRWTEPDGEGWVWVEGVTHSYCGDACGAPHYDPPQIVEPIR